MRKGLARIARTRRGQTLASQFWHHINSRSSRSRQRGSLSEMAMAIPVLLLLGLSTLQGSLIYHGKSTLNYATFEAARTGAVNHAQEGAMRHELGIRLAPLQGGDGSTERAATAILKARTFVENRLQTRIRIINPTINAFNDWGVDDPDTGELLIPGELTWSAYAPDEDSFGSYPVNSSLTVRNDSEQSVSISRHGDVLYLDDENYLIHWERLDMEDYAELNGFTYTDEDKTLAASGGIAGFSTSQFFNIDVSGESGTGFDSPASRAMVYVEQQCVGESC